MPRTITTFRQVFAAVLTATESLALTGTGAAAGDAGVTVKSVSSHQRERQSDGTSTPACTPHRRC
jgi:hypothetical protein